MIRRTLAVAAAALTIGVPPATIAQEASLSGRATAEARRPYSDYSVQTIDVQTRQVSASVPLSDDGRFVFEGLQNDKVYLVQLFNIRENRIICTEGPFALVTPNLTRTDVNISCRRPAALWLLAAGAGVATTVAVVTQSSSR